MHFVLWSPPFFLFKLQSCEVFVDSVLFVHAALRRGLIWLLTTNIRKKSIDARQSERKLKQFDNTCEELRCLHGCEAVFSSPHAWWSVLQSVSNRKCSYVILPLLFLCSSRAQMLSPSRLGLWFEPFKPHGLHWMRRNSQACKSLFRCI